MQAIFHKKIEWDLQMPFLLVKFAKISKIKFKTAGKMTAVVGVLNKQAVAIAADSAGTIEGTNGHKIFNKANKVFALSKCQPVGIMLYNSASFMGTPWETIIKVYRKQLGDRHFPKLRNYQADFLEFLRAKKYYTSSAAQLSALHTLVLHRLDKLLRQIIEDNVVLFQNPTVTTREQFLALFESHLDAAMQQQVERCCVEFQDYSLEAFECYSRSVLEEIIQLRFTDDGYFLSPSMVAKLKQWAYSIVCSLEDDPNYTGLIFVGFGEDEIFPSLIPIHVAQVIDDRLRFEIDEEWSATIDHDNHALVRPFAQTDVIETLLTGIDPSLDQVYSANFEALLTKYNTVVLDRIRGSDPLLAAQIAGLDPNILVAEFQKLNQEIRVRDYIRPLIDAVGSLSKEDLAEMAESLIYLTYLKRRITFAEESVGGPVDVAVISKGDGFVWIKQKHYFKPELNPQFFNQYYRSSP
jgi:hypothetical protein